MNRIFLFFLFIASYSVADELPLFASDTPIDITFEFPLNEIIKHADEGPVVEGHASYENTAGELVVIPIKLTTRGRSRLEYCRFPPLSITFNKKQSKGTIFEGQKKKLKIVTHCRQSSAHRKYIIQEQRIYEALNVLTDVSFRTRVLKATYQNSERPDQQINEPAFIIESIFEVADRNDLKRQKVNKVLTSQLDPDYATVSALFQFMIGNTDWSVLSGPSGKDCCHNSRPLSPSRADTGWFVVPYDFDQAGLINTRYAVVAAPLPIKTVRQRLFRGRCVHLDQIEPAVAMFNERRQQLEMALILEGSAKDKSYIDGFYKIVNDPKQRARQVDGACLSS